MGANQCCSGTNQSVEANNYFYEFGEDRQEPLTLHSDRIETNDDACKFFLTDCEKRLKLSSRLYKDPSVSSQPMLLKESESRGSRQIRCVFNRPYHFLKAARGSKYAILPSKLGNCDDICLKHDALQYFSMFLCFLADKPHLLSDIILTRPNSYGIQVIAMYYKGERKHVFIDDYILCHENKPIFSQPVGEAMWPCLIEKAWLKVKGYSSHQIVVTSPLQVFQHFLQYPCANYQLGQIEEEAYRKLKGILKGKEQAMIAISKQEPRHKIGLSGRKSYYLKFLFNFQGKTLYYLRNPCGNFDFRGIHKTMSPELQARLRSDGEEIIEGNFVLEEEQFLQQMEAIEVAFYNSNSAMVSQEMLMSKGGEEIFVQLDLPSHEEVSLNFVQVEEPYYPLTYQVISRKDGRILSGITNEDGCFGIRSTNLLEDTFQRLAPGSYLIRLKKKPKKLYQEVHQTNDKIVVTASCKVDINYTMHEEYRDQFYQFLFEYGVHGMSRISESHQRGREVQHWSFWVGDLVVVCVRQLEHGKRPINLEVSFPERVNLECISHSLNAQFTAVPFVDPHLLIIFEKIDLTGQTALGKYFIDTF